MNTEKMSRNLTMMMDFYELTMAAGYFEDGYQEKIAVFDMFFRQIPDDGGFAIMAGLAQFIEAIENFGFTEADIDYLRSKGEFSEPFLDYLRNFSFHCNVWAIEEGTPIFPGEPMLTVEGPCIEAQLIETLLLVTFNHQSLICTKANRVVRACNGRTVLEFGARRAQGYDAALYGARAAYIGGVAATSCVMADREFGIPAAGTMAHSWVQMFPTEYEAFKRYAEIYPENCMLLVDTYSVVKSGIPNAIRVFDEVLKPRGIRPKGIRIDSGDIAYLSKKSRKMLEAAGYGDVEICASNSLDEYIVRDLLLQGAELDSFGIGENLITSKSDPVFGGVYKLAAVKENGAYIPKIKVSETAAKITTPHLKKLWRIYDNATGKAMADYITMFDEEVDATNGITLFDPVETWKQKTFTNCTAVLLSTPIYQNGKLVYQSPPLADIRARCMQQVDLLWEEVKRFENPHRYYVDLSRKLWDERQRLLHEAGGEQ
ncbi:nicotinate phosphoribosyltransferase [Ruminococcaceae bacterium OttesenSCG-928-A16]|nr:nicotinate phosphoribosyltransferase [Ruminococcaceae bacterium OttesenSCG-928-A16]